MGILRRIAKAEEKFEDKFDYSTDEWTETFGHAVAFARGLVDCEDDELTDELLEQLVCWIERAANMPEE